MAKGPNGNKAAAKSTSTADEAPIELSAKEVSSSKKRKASPIHATSNQAKSASKDSKPENGLESSQSSTARQSTPPPLPDEPAPPPLPDEPAPPPLPDEEPPSQEPEDDGWEPVWDDTNQAFYFYNRFTQLTQWDNPRVPVDQGMPTNHDRIPSASGAPGTTPQSHATSSSTTKELHPAVVGGYNPAIHGSYDPNAAYAQYTNPLDPTSETAAQDDSANPDSENYAGAANFNRFTGRFQSSALQPSNFNDESKSKRQMNAFFDVDAAANSHDGRSLKAERAGKKLTKSEVKQFKEKRRERKEEKRRAWLRD